ncbi:VanZ family protein [Wenyingzhuangia sp. chi5]|uniref:VanZ family protein n=1 Tax=Wenyingzhuangia gilva TaxID=3057677 RepID=A0ABT8VQ53_9FLAO|nr:VanZ family protein [Wenyingzhuangia sp. chi5]MDO3694099.1 VanZ family protein [Wenyingzhuangia sp. chi5]
MLKRIKNLLERNSLFFAISSSVLVLILSLINMEGVPNFNYSYTDKFEHVFAYAVISFFWMLSCKLGKLPVSFFSLFLIIIAYGIIIELLQLSLTSHRTGDLMDVMANSIGVILGFIFLKILSRIYLQV